MPEVEKRIVCAAIMNGDGEIITSARHYDPLMHKQIEASKNIEAWTGKRSEIIQGFIDQFGTFYDREDALIIARLANQIIRPSTYETNQLYSENLY